MTAPSPLRKGWCPSLHRPMETGDGWLVRLPVRHGILSSNQARAIANLAQQHGNGHIDLTARGNLQLRGITAASHEPLMQDLHKLDMAREPALQIVTSPLATLDPACDPGVFAIAQAIEDLVADHPGVTLPAKFFCAVDGGGAVPLALQADLYFAAPFVMADILRQVGEVITNLPKTRKLSGVAGSPAPSPGYLPLSPATAVVGLALPFGRMTAADLSRLASLAEQHGTGELRLAPWRMVFLPVSSPLAAQSLLAGAQQAGFIVDGFDARRHIQACPGAPACSSAAGETRSLALQLAKSCGDMISAGKSVHVSGCAKGCARPAPADIMITAEAGRYNLAFNAKAGDPADHVALTPEAVTQILLQRKNT